MTFIQGVCPESSEHDHNASSSRPIRENMTSLSLAHDVIAPIFYLPDELVILVFKEVQRNRRTTTHGGNFNDKQFVEDKWKDIIIVSHVCRRWRSIALNCPSYWSRINFSTFLIAEEMLSRTKSSPISVEIDIHHRDLVSLLSPSFISRLLDAARLRELHLFLPMTHLHYLLDGVSGRSFPFLQSLHIEVLGADLWAPAFQILSLPMPHVHHIGLFSCTVPWDELCKCTSLVSLEIDGSRSGGRNGPKPSSRQFFDVLASNPNLERVLFCSTLPELSNDPILPIKLPKLSSCMVTGASVLETVAFQAHISYPSNTSEILFSPEEPGPTDASAIAALLSSCGVLSKPSPRTCMLFQKEEDGDLRIVLAPTAMALDQYHVVDHTIPNQTAAIELKSEILLGPHLLVELLSIPGLEEITIIVDSDSCPSDIWFGFFQRHPEIRVLSIAFWAAQSVLTALLTHTVAPIHSSEERGLGRQASPAGGVTLCLPNLDTFSMLRPDVCDEAEILNETLDVRLLYRCLSERRKCGLQIRRFDLELSLDSVNEVDLNVKALREEVDVLTLYRKDSDTTGERHGDVNLSKEDSRLNESLGELGGPSN